MFITPAHAQAASGATASTGGALLGSGLLPMLFIFVAFYFLLIRPQQKRAKALQQSIMAVKRGDQVVTAGGILGRVVKVDDAQVEVEIAPNTRVRVVKSTLAEVVTGAKPAND